MSREEVHNGSNPQGKSDIVNDLEELIGLFCDVGGREGTGCRGNNLGLGLKAQGTFKKQQAHW